MFRVTPRQGEAVDVSVGIKSGRAENNVAKDVRDALRRQAEPRSLHRRSRRRRGHPDQEEGRPAGLRARAGRVQRAERQHQGRRRIAREYFPKSVRPGIRRGAPARRCDMNPRHLVPSPRRCLRSGALHWRPTARRWRRLEHRAHRQRRLERRSAFPHHAERRQRPRGNHRAGDHPARRSRRGAQHPQCAQLAIAARSLQRGARRRRQRAGQRLTRPA